MVDFDALLPHSPLPPGPPELTRFPLPFSQSHQPSSQLEFAVCEFVSVKEVCVGVCGCVSDGPATCWLPISVPKTNQTTGSIPTFASHTKDLPTLTESL